MKKIVVLSVLLFAVYASLFSRTDSVYIPHKNIIKTNPFIGFINAGALGYERLLNKHFSIQFSAATQIYDYDDVLYDKKHYEYTLDYSSYTFILEYRYYFTNYYRRI